MPLIEARYEHGQLTALMKRATFARLGRSHALGEGVRDAAEKLRQRAVRNVSGYPVTYTGGAFRVSVKTGALKAAIEMEWPYGDPLTARVFVNGAHTSISNTGGYVGKPTPVGRYAAAIEHGHKEIDLKQTMMGKVVPFFGSRAQNPKGPYSATGLHKTSSFTLAPGVANLGFGGSSDELVHVHTGYQSDKLNRKLLDQGKRPMVFERKRTASGSAYFISFRKVGKHGWIIPAAKPRPFMAAAGQNSVNDVRRIIGGKVRTALTER